MHEQRLGVWRSQLGSESRREERRQGSSGCIAARAAQLALEQAGEPAQCPRSQHGMVVARGLHERAIISIARVA